MRYNSPGFRLFAALIVLVVTSTALIGLWISGSPAKERARRLDDRRIQDLQSISNAIDNYYNQNASALPPTLESLTRVRDAYYVSSIVDPDTMTPYEYAVESTSTYRLCATFTTDSRGISKDPNQYAQPYNSSAFWEHNSERTCFTITAKVYPK
ncbi:MAG: type II secretion system protein [Candidatus Uhrbacteria bacterium]